MKIKKCLVSIFILVITSGFYPQSLDQKSISTFSIVARDSVTGELGIAVASRFFSVVLSCRGQKQMLAQWPHNLSQIQVLVGVV